MNYYIPFTFSVDGKQTSDVFQAIMAAEGIAPFRAGTFRGLNAVNSSPWLTGKHFLNPLEDSVLLYSRIPVIDKGGKYATAWHYTGFVEVEDNEWSISFVMPPEDTGVCLGGGQCKVFRTSGAVFFRRPAHIRFIFADETQKDFRFGCRETAYSKNAMEFRFSILDVENQDAACVVHVMDDEIDKLEDLSKIDASVFERATKESLLQEKRYGAMVALQLTEPRRNLAPIAERENKVKRALEDYFADCENSAELVQSIKEECCQRRSERFEEEWRRCDFKMAEDDMQLMEKFCEVVESLHQGPSVWNWADNDSRATLADRAFKECVCPVLKMREKEKDVKTYEHEASLIVRKFREPFRFALAESALHSPFMKALLIVLNSEGREDRICEKRNNKYVLPLYGAMCGYAKVSIIRFLAKDPVATLPETLATQEGREMSDCKENCPILKEPEIQEVLKQCDGDTANKIQEKMNAEYKKGSEPKNIFKWLKHKGKGRIFSVLPERLRDNWIGAVETVEKRGLRDERKSKMGTKEMVQSDLGLS